MQICMILHLFGYNICVSENFLYYVICYILLFLYCIKHVDFCKKKKKFSKQNLGGKICIDVAHRMGKKARKARPIMARFVTRSGRDMVLKRGRLLKSSSFAISEQLPPNTRECRMTQTPMLASSEEKPGQQAPEAVSSS